MVISIASFLEKKTDESFVLLQNSHQLLSAHTKLINDIYHHSHAPKSHFDKLYLYAIKRLAVWAQALPASQNHHHADNGGFLLHTLEVAEIALRFRNTKMLPVGASVEKQNAKKDVWTFAIFVAALLHDIGKTVNDVHLMLYNKKKQELGRWSAWHGSMTQVKEARYYRYEYNRSRKYEQHGLLPLAFINEFISPDAMDWLHKESELFNLLLMTLQNRYAEGGIIGDITKYADSESCALSLQNRSSNSNNSNNTTPEPKSLADKLLDTMRYLVLETDIKINQPGAPIFTDATDMYFVSKVFMDSIRDSLNQDKQKGIPFDNSRMMDELLQFHIITPNTEGKAIWSITISDGGFKKPVALTMLKVSLDKIFIDSKYPKPFTGVINSNDSVTDSPEPPNNNNVPIQPNNTQQETQPIEIDLPLPPGFDLPITAEETKDTVDDNNAQTTEPKKVSSSVQPKQKSATILKTELGKDFMAWLVEAINNKKIAINTVTAKAHVVDYNNSKALFLVSPKIFKEYSTDNWARTQKQFGRLKISLKTETDENIWQVQTKTFREGKKPSIIKGYLIIDTNKYGFNDLPALNKYLDLIDF